MGAKAAISSGLARGYTPPIAGKAPCTGGHMCSGDLYYGFGDSHFYLRVDPIPEVVAEMPSFQLRLTIWDSRETRISLRVEDGKMAGCILEQAGVCLLAPGNGCVGSLWENFGNRAGEGIVRFARAPGTASGGRFVEGWAASRRAASGRHAEHRARRRILCMAAGITSYLFILLSLNRYLAGTGDSQRFQIKAVHILLDHAPRAELRCDALNRGLHHFHVSVRDFIVGALVIKRNDLLFEQAVDCFGIRARSVSEDRIVCRTPSRSSRCSLPSTSHRESIGLARRSYWLSCRWFRWLPEEAQDCSTTCPLRGPFVAPNAGRNPPQMRFGRRLRDPRPAGKSVE